MIEPLWFCCLRSKLWCLAEILAMFRWKIAFEWTPHWQTSTAGKIAASFGLFFFLLLFLFHASSPWSWVFITLFAPQSCFNGGYRRMDAVWAVFKPWPLADLIKKFETEATSVLSKNFRKNAWVSSLFLHQFLAKFHLFGCWSCMLFV